MAFQFPPSPAVDQTFTPVAGVTYRWSGTAWHLLAGPGSFISQADADTRYVNVDEASNTTNRIINGKMAIDQRNAGALMNAATGYTLDRWAVNNGSVSGVVSVRQQAFLGDFNFLLTVTTAGTLGAGNIVAVQQMIEGLNLTDLHYGFPDAAPMTLAFDVLATVTGAFSATFYNGLAAKSYVAPYTISVANTWETKVITVPGDAAAAMTTNTGLGLALTFSLGTGATFATSIVNTWQAGNFISKVGDTNFVGTVGNAFRLRNVRLYKGSVDFGPDRRLYAEELALCQRYYEKTFRADVAPANGVGAHGDILIGGPTLASGTLSPAASWRFVVPKRAAPTVTLYNIRAGGAAGQWTTASADGANARSLSPCDSGVMIDNTDVQLAATSKWYIAATASAEL